MSIDHKPYVGLKASLLTQHGKESVICPELLSANGLEVIHVKGYDTDKLGTFTRDIPRYGSQLDAARKKARIGMELSGLPIGLASEGAFSNDPYTGLLPWNYELVVLVDDVHNIEITGFYSGEAQSASKPVPSWDELMDFLSEAQFPSHQLVVRPDDEYHPECRKGINTIKSLRDAYDWAISISKNGSVFAENDLRAHANPTRMSNIFKATQDLAKKMASLCPQCHSPGFSITETKKGLPCSYCAMPTNLPIAHVWSCVKCGHKKDEVIVNPTSADPSKCNFCNP
jgi:Zn finger protein HypA/HybF involved in hydrogenase expression